MKHELHIEPEVIFKKRKGHGHGHHGRAWKVAYAAFVTAIMAFFMMLWTIGATNDEQRMGIADYFTPTVIEMRNSGGSNGIMGGRSLSQEDGNALKAELAGRRPLTAITRQPSNEADNRRRTADEARLRQSPRNHQRAHRWRPDDERPQRAGPLCAQSRLTDHSAGFENKELIEASYRRIRIVDMAGLQAVSGRD